MKTQYNQEFDVDALMVAQCDETFLLGTDFIKSKAATIDFLTSEMHWKDEQQTFIMPFVTWVDSSKERLPAQVRLDVGRSFATFSGANARVAVSGKEGETGVFLPTPREDGLLATAVVATIKESCNSVPVLNTNTKTTRPPTRACLGTWIPCDEAMTIMELEEHMQRDLVSDWSDSLKKPATADGTE